MMRLLLVNPNTSVVTTDAMVAIARETDPSLEIVGMTAPEGARIITGPEELATAGTQVETMVVAAHADPHQGFVIAAFGDPGIARARALTRVPVTGLAEAGLLAGGAGGRPFGVVTTTPGLVSRIEVAAREYGVSPTFQGVWLTAGEPQHVMADEDRLLEALLEASRRALRESRLQAIVIGGGPLARAARRMRGLLDAPVIEPLPEAIRLARARATITSHGTDRTP